MGGFYQTAPENDSSRWRPFVVAAVLIIVVVAVIWLFSRHARKSVLTVAADPYAASLRFGDLKLSTAENFVGGSVTYVEGKVQNAGDKIVTAASVETIFRNSLGEVVQTDTQPLRVQSTALGKTDFVALKAAPLQPGQTLEFRLSFEHISADWNQGFPEIRVVKTTLK